MKISPKKRFSQNFLKNDEISKNIAALVSKKNILIEVGPGTGCLTKNLFEHKNLHLVEIDLDCVNFLKRKFPQIKEKIKNENFLSLNLKKTFGEKLSIIGNFPYNISNKIFSKIINDKDCIVELIGMFQKEVAERVCSKKGKNRGFNSVMIQAFYDCEICFDVEKENFFPTPKVTSTVIKLVRNNRKKLNCDNQILESLLKHAFKQKRKKLRNALKKFNFDKNFDIILDKRAEELSFNDFELLAQNVNP